MTTTEIYWGETLIISGDPTTPGGSPIVLDETWSADCVITKNRIGGEVVARPVMAIMDGVPTTTIDTGDQVWTHGVYYFDIRVTDPAGNDHWSDPGRIVMKNRNARPS